MTPQEFIANKYKPGDMIDYDEVCNLMTDFKQLPEKQSPMEPLTQREQLEFIMNAVSGVMGTNEADIKSHSRHYEFVFCRQHFCYFAFHYTNIQIRIIGLFLNGRDHSTIIHNRNKAIDFIKNNRKFKTDNEKIKETIKYVLTFKGKRAYNPLNNIRKFASV